LTVRQLYERAAARYAGIDSYIARLTRREQIKTKHNPEEVLLFKFRKNPWSVHFKWLGPVAHGREVLYVKDHYENKLHTLLAAGDAPFMPAGKRLDLPIDSMMVRAASRHSITEAGIGASLEKMEASIAAQERGETPRLLNLLPLQKRPEYPQPVEAFEQTIPLGGEPELPRGGRRLVCFDPEWHLPLLAITHDNQGQEVEYYRFDLLQTPVRLDDDDFNPDKLWANGDKKPAEKR
jgi:hypothetical protein